MIPWKRTLGWTLCWAVASTAVVAEEPGTPGATDAGTEMTAPAPSPDPGTADDSAAANPVGDADLAEAPAPVEPAQADASAAESTAIAESPEVVPATQAAPAAEAEPRLGAVAYDSEGRQGRIHIVVAGDTLWDISTAYLGTPWVWPSIWKDNGEIENPHLIHPGDHIWITPTEMRRLTADEAAQMLSNVPAAPAEPVAAIEDAVPVMDAAPAPAAARTVRVSARETAGLISPEAYTSSASVVGRVPDRLLLSQEDALYIGLGEGEVKVGDQFTLFRTNQKVMDPDTDELLGYHVDFLGWVKVVETAPETSLATIRMSTGEIEVGDRVMPREPLPPEIDVRAAPDGVEGKITFFPDRRVLLGFQDFVYLNRGTLDGLEVGSPLEVYRGGYPAREVSRDETVEVPDRVIARMLVVRAEDQTAVAMVTTTATELQLGDKFRAETQTH